MEIVPWAVQRYLDTLGDLFSFRMLKFLLLFLRMSLQLSMLVQPGKDITTRLHAAEILK